MEPQMSEEEKVIEDMRDYARSLKEKAVTLDQKMAALHLEMACLEVMIVMDGGTLSGRYD
jgi:uncharacterized coiled-coil DUF342 family protein